jgi:transcriptional regulator with XRE-family HTH domain
MLLAVSDPHPLPFCHVHLNGPRPLPRSYPQVLATLADYLRKRRLDLGLLQRELAELLGVDEATVTNWELNRTSPALHFLPGITDLIGYLPWAAGSSIGERLLAYRRDRGITQEVMARRLGVDPVTLSRWERGLRVPAGRHDRLVQAFLKTD